MNLQPKQPTLLMLSHCVPDALGNAARARVWQLLKLVARTHHVHLACRMDGPIRLDQWRAANGLSRRLMLKMPATRLQFFDWLRRHQNPTLQDEARQLAPEEGFDVVLCTHPSLMADAQAIQARFKVCDVDAPVSAWRLGSAARGEISPQRLATTFDLITAGHPSYIQDAVLQHRPAVVLPDAVDLASYPLTSAGATLDELSAPVLLFHANWQNRLAQEPFAWFRRQVWPAIQEAVPNATFIRTPAAHEINGSGSVDLLRTASVVVLPENNPRIARWPVLQAMASQRPVITSAPAVADLGARSGEHLLAAENERDWTRLCIESLRSAGIRHKLARGARAFLELQSPSAAGRETLHALNALRQRPLAHAA